jgi:hypothetical protein
MHVAAAIDLQKRPKENSLAARLQYISVGESTRLGKQPDSALLANVNPPLIVRRKSKNDPLIGILMDTACTHKSLPLRDGASVDACHVMLHLRSHVCAHSFTRPNLTRLL